MSTNKCWYKEMAVYQIWPRSFCDGNGDGIGDIKGIMSKLDYIKSLGVDAIWFSPLYKSPQEDMGYDIADYKDIAEEYGTLDEFKELLEAIHARGMKVIMDLVINHTSNQHKWFLESMKSKDKFIWVDSGEVELDIDHQHVVLKKEQLVPLSHLHHLEFLRIEGKCYALMFNGNFYCIHGNDHEVSCNGLLFHGSSHVLTFVLSEDERRKIDTLTRIMQEEFLSTDHLQDEMLRVLLKRFIILCTRIAEDRQGAVRENSLQFEIGRAHV